MLQINTKRGMIKNMKETQYMKTKDYADHLGVNVQTVRRWIRGGQLNAIRLTPRGTYLIPMDNTAHKAKIDSND